MREIRGKLTVRPNLCYFSTCEKNWLRDEDCLGDFTKAKRLQNLVGSALGKASDILRVQVPSS